MMPKDNNKVKQESDIIDAIDTTLETLEYYLNYETYIELLPMILDIRNKHIKSKKIHLKERKDAYKIDVALAILDSYYDNNKNSIYVDIADRVRQGYFYIHTDIRDFKDFGKWYYKEFSSYKYTKDNEIEKVLKLADFTNYGKEIYNHHSEYILSKKLGLLHILW